VSDLTPSTTASEGALIGLRFTPDIQAAYLARLEECGNEVEAAKLLKVPYRAVKSLRQTDQAFRELEQTAMEVFFKGTVEKEAVRRAVKGVRKGVYYKGEHIGDERVFSDTLMKQQLEAGDPKKYGKNVHHDHTVRVGVLVVNATLSEADFEAQYGQPVEIITVQPDSNEEA